ncbi:tetratricopeptide repeat protein [bacterium SCSIO 12741]|nr:tetratricopeptide repeat protein [bacterium SCSIO 12741]
MYSNSLSNDSLKQVMLEGPNVESRAEAGLLYADRIIYANYDSSLWAIDQVILDGQKNNYEKGVARAKSLKSWLYLIRARYEDALRAAHDALAIQEQQNQDTLELAKTLNMLGAINLELGRFEESLVYMERALHILLVLNDTSRLDRAYNNLGSFHFESGNYREAITYYKESRKKRVSLKDYQRVAYSDYNLGCAYLELDRIDSAVFFMERSQEIFANQTSSGRIPDMVYIGLGRCYLAQNKLNSAIEYIQKGLQMSIASGYADRWVRGYDVLAKALFQAGRHEESYLALKRRCELADSLGEENNAKAIAEIEERYQSAQNEKKLMTSVAKNLEQENKIIKMESAQTRVWLMALILVFLIATAAIYKIQRKRASEASLQADLASARLTALQSQMNPHFIFNCINTSQNFVIEGENNRAYDYLSRFAKLLRGVLESSGLSYVSLENEINLINHYLSLEAIRFDEKFSYKVTVEEKLRSGTFEIPGMVIQPFVENAITHGLINLEGKKGNLSIQLYTQDSHVICEIEDNGVGRQKAAEIKSRKQRRYASKALANIEERLNLLNQNRSMEVGYEIRDLSDESGEPAGTHVKIWLPYL